MRFFELLLQNIRRDPQPKESHVVLWFGKDFRPDEVASEKFIRGFQPNFMIDFGDGMKFYGKIFQSSGAGAGELVNIEMRFLPGKLGRSSGEVYGLYSLSEGNISLTFNERKGGTQDAPSENT